MKNYLLIISIILISLLSSVIFAEDTSFDKKSGWSRHGAPVLSVGSKSSWDEKGVFNPMVIRDGRSFSMWYSGIDSEGVMRIGYALSEDGIRWKKHSGISEGKRLCPHVEGPGCIMTVSSDKNSWDSARVYGPAVVIDRSAPENERYKMWYTGLDRKARPYNKWRTGYALSSDGIIWKRHGDNLCPTNSNGPGCVIDVGASGDVDDDVVGGASVIVDSDGVFRIWYEACKYIPGDTLHSCRIGYARSADGIVWKKYTDQKGDDLCPSVGGKGCVMDRGPEGSWYGFHLSHPFINKGPDSSYDIWYSGTDGDGKWKIGHAVSSDGIRWNKDPDKSCGTGCFFSPSDNGWDNISVADPSVIIEPDRLLVWYTGVGDKRKVREIGLAVYYVKPDYD